MNNGHADKGYSHGVSHSFEVYKGWVADDTGIGMKPAEADNIEYKIK